ncbi:MAG: hypothetical protein LAT56_06565 [Wenzhouxiangella sp.]|nr:hypothetical protein [Wenzhouxiangella sp.]
MHITFKLGTVVVLALVLGTAWAHHGWTWAEDEQTEMTGTIEDIFVGYPHPRLMIETEDEGRWQVDVGNPRQTAAAGFDEHSASVGDKVLVRGHRSLDSEQQLIKAVRITIDGQQFTFYPHLLRED